MDSFFRAFAQLFHMVVQLFIIVIIVRSVLSWIGNMPPNSLIIILRRLTDPIFRLVHRHLPFTIIGGIDISPIFIVIGLIFLDNFITNLLLNYAESF